MERLRLLGYQHLLVIPSTDIPLGMAPEPSTGILPYRFAPGDTDAWLAHLRAEGYVVLKGCLAAAECSAAESLLWDWLERLGSGIRRDDAGVVGGSSSAAITLFPLAGLFSRLAVLFSDFAVLPPY